MIQIVQNFMSEDVFEWNTNHLHPQLWYEFLDDLDSQSDFDRNFVTKKVFK